MIAYHDLPQPVRDMVLSSVSAHFHLSLEELFGRGRKPDICQARWVAIGLFRDLHITNAAIGRAIQRDRSTVLHGIHTLSLRQDLQEAVKILEAMIPARVWAALGCVENMPPVDQRVGYATSYLRKEPADAIRSLLLCVLLEEPYGASQIWWGTELLTRWPRHRSQIMESLYDLERIKVEQFLEHQERIASQARSTTLYSMR